MRLTIYHEILHSEQYEGAEFIYDNGFLWFLTPVNVGTCHLLGHSFEQKNSKCFNFDENLHSAQGEGAEFNGDNSFL